MSGIKYEVLTGDDLISALRGGRTGDLLDDAAYAAADEIESLRSRLAEATELLRRTNDAIRDRPEYEFVSNRIDAFLAADNEQ